MGGFQFARQCCMKNGSDLQQTLSLQAPKFKAMFVKFTKILGYWSMLAALQLVQCTYYIGMLCLINMFSLKWLEHVCVITPYVENQGSRDVYATCAFLRNIPLRDWRHKQETWRDAADAFRYVSIPYP